MMFHPHLSKVDYQGKFELKKEADDCFSGVLTTVESGEQIERYFLLVPFLPHVQRDKRRCDFEIVKNVAACPSGELFSGEALFSPDRSLIYMTVTTDRCHFVGQYPVPLYC